MRILNFGSCNIDYVYSLPHIVMEGETEAAERLEVFPGGKGLNQSVAMARAGAEVFHAGCIGQEGTMLRDLLTESGADVSYLEIVNERNGHAIIQVSERGENSILLFPGANSAVTEEQIRRVLDCFGAGDVLVLQNEISHVDTLVKEGYAHGMRIVLNPSPYNEQIEKIDLSMLSYLILNEVEIGQLTGCDDPRRGLAMLAARYPTLQVVLTLGGDGCLYRKGEKELWQSVFTVAVKDTTAAGDTFTGYFVAAVSRGKEIAEALCVASAAAAISVSRMGAAPSIPRCDEVNQFLNEREGR